MKFPNQVKPISYLKSHASEIVRELSESGEPILITQDGKAKLVLMDAESYEYREELLALLTLLALGKHEIQQGHFRDAEAVLTDFDRPDIESVRAQ